MPDLRTRNVPWFLVAIFAAGLVFLTIWLATCWGGVCP